MIVSVDVSAVPAAPAGAGRYIIELTAALARRGDPAMVLVSRRTDAGRWRSLAGSSATVIAGAPSARPLRLAWEQAALPGVLRRSGAHVHHGPHYTMPVRSRLPMVVSVLDCTFFDHPEWHERSKVLLFRRAITVAARRAAVVVCPSETTARHLAAEVDVAGDVVVASLGVDHTRFSPSQPAGADDVAELRRIGVDPERPWVVFLGTIEPRKDVATLVRAFAELADATSDVGLVVAGGRGWKDEGVVRALDETARHRPRIRFTGYVPDAAVAALLRRAAAVAYPSLAEGYGLPALEALAAGAPLVTTEGTAMAELAGDAAVLVPPGDSAALAGALAEVVAAGRSDPAAARRREMGLAIAATRTWEASAERHAEAYQRAAGR